jgi:hypothetical protein
MQRFHTQTSQEDSNPFHPSKLKPKDSFRYFETAALPELDCEGHEKIRPIFNQFYSNKGDYIQIAMLLPGDWRTVVELNQAEAERARLAGEEFMAPREPEKIKHGMETGKLIFYGAIVNGDGMGAVAAMEGIDDEKDMGRGKAFYGMNGKCTVDKQSWFKNTTTHPDMRDTGIIKEVFVPRLIGTMAIFPERSCMVTKSNNPPVIEFYGNKDKANWHVVNVDKETLAHLKNPDHQTLITFATNVEEVIPWIGKKCPSIIIEDEIQKHRAAYKTIYGLH